jgi:hypothetical protein
MAMPSNGKDAEQIVSPLHQSVTMSKIVLDS